MNKTVVPAFLFVLFLVFLACHQTKNLSSYSLEQRKFINYDKVRIDITTGKNSYSLKGFIRFKLDSSVCFQFWGPLGYEIVRGIYTNNKLQVRTKDNIRISETTIESNLGLVLDNSLLQYLFLGFDSLLIDHLKIWNASVIEINNYVRRANETSISIFHKVNKKNVGITFLKKNGILNTILINLKQENIAISVQIIERSYIEKMCNFRF